MPELLVLNPAPKRRRAARKGGKRRTAAQRAATAKLVALNRSKRRKNPVKRVRHSMRRRVAARSNPVRKTHRRRRNPIGGISMRSFSASNVMNILKGAAIGGVGALGMDFIMGKINEYLPASMQPQSSTEIDVSDAVKAGFTIVLGRMLSKTTKGLSEKMATGSLIVQAYQLTNILAAKYAPSMVSGVGYASPAYITNGNARVSPLSRMNPAAAAALARGRVGMFNAPGGQSPLLSGVGAFNAPGNVSPLLRGASNVRAREGVKYR